MTDAIDRQAAIATAVRAAIDWHKLANPQYSIAYCIGEAMRGLPSVQPERKKGKWIPVSESGCVIECSACGERMTALIGDKPSFCCYCGADMRGEQQNE